MLFLPTAVAAQEPSLPLNENVLGETTLAKPYQQFSFQSTTETPYQVSVRSLSADFAPIIVITNSQGQRVAWARNPVRAQYQQVTFTPQVNLPYTLRVAGADGEVGEFVINVQPIELDAANALELDTEQRERVSAELPMQTYAIPAHDTAQVVQILSELPDGSSLMMVTDETDNIIGLASQRSQGSAFILPPKVAYTVTILHSGLDRVEPYVIQLQPFTGQTLLEIEGACRVTTDNSGGVYIRAEPEPSAFNLKYLLPEETYPIVARTEDSAWWQIQLDDETLGWVEERMIIRIGNCANVQMLD